MKNSTESRKTRYTRKILRDSLIELMKQKPVSKITVKELCALADVNRTTFYTHYEDPFDLLYEIGDETLLWVREALANIVKTADASETLKIMETIFQYIIDNGSQIQILMSERGDLDFQKQLMTAIYRQFGADTPLIKTDPETREDALVFVVSGSVGLIRHWLKTGMTKTARQMAEFTLRVTPFVR